VGLSLIFSNTNAFSGAILVDNSISHPDQDIKYSYYRRYVDMEYNFMAITNNIAIEGRSTTDGGNLFGKKRLVL
jgi:hypothetical protein